MDHLVASLGFSVLKQEFHLHVFEIPFSYSTIETSAHHHIAILGVNQCTLDLVLVPDFCRKERALGADIELRDLAIFES